MAGEGVRGLLGPDGQLMCPAGTHVVEAHVSSLCPKLPKGRCAIGGCPGKVGGAYL